MQNIRRFRPELVAVACSLLLSGPALARETGADLQRRFDRLADVYVDGLARLSPSDATAMGDHRFDDRLTDISADGRAARRQRAEELLNSLARMPRAHLTRERQVDAAILEQALRYELWRVKLH